MDESGIVSQESADEYLRLAWKQYAGDKLYNTAEENFRRAIEMAPDNVDAHYGLALALKAQRRIKEAVDSFKKTAELIEAGALEDHDRSEMLHRLSIGHINRIETGDWNLEKEIWRKEK